MHRIEKKTEKRMKENCGKIENILNLALDATREEREKSLNLDVGYDVADDSWEVIVKFFGTTEELRQKLSERFPEEQAQIGIYNLTNEYAILRIPQPLVELVASMPEIEYMEKPKRLFFSVENGKRSSCINPLQTGQGTSPTSNLTGKEVLVAVIDSGIDYAHPDFCNSDGTTRIAVLWDQTLDTVYERETINLALRQESEQEQYAICPSRDASGHGTHVAGIAAGNGRASNGRYRGVAYESEMIVVKLGVPRETSFPKTTELMSAVDFCIARARQYGKPIALNLSFGNNYGSHSGNSLIETYLDDMANYWKTSIVIGSGNEGSAAVHTAGKLTLNEEQEVEIAVSAYEASLNLQIWKNYVDEIGVSVIHPGGTAIGPLQRIQGTQRFQLGETNLLVYYGEPSPYNPYQEIYLDFIPVGSYIDDGIWKIRLTPIRITDGAFDMWLPAGNVLNSGTGFLNPVEETTLTIPSTATKVITVGAYDARFDQAAAFSGRGYTRATNQVKPDLVAPGVEIMSCAPGGGYQVRTGTSMATPFVTGSAALLMQWGITDGNDAYLYGEKMKAYLIRGARRLPGFTAYPNPVLGWGALCTADSIP
jgi:minor extracellular serine protease Vpr